MSSLSASEHLKIARRLHFQDQTEEAIREYLLVLEIDPDNEDAASGLLSLGVEPPDTSRFREVESGSGVKTNFFVNQAKATQLSPWRTGPFKIVIGALACLAIWAVYYGVNYFLNWDNIIAAKNVDARISKVRNLDKNTLVNVKVDNFNPGAVRNMVISYQLMDAKGNLLKGGTLKVDGSVPPGDSRTFADIDLGELTATPDKIEQKLESLVYGPKPKLNERLTDAFIAASMKPDKESFGDFDELTQDAFDFPPALIGMGRAYAARGDYKRAIEQYKQAVQLDPENANAHYYMAVAMYYNGDKAGAREHMEKAVTLAPDDPKYQESSQMLTDMKAASDSARPKSEKTSKAAASKR